MKLNLGSGKDVRLGYTNIDIAGGPNVVRGDFRNLDSCGIANESVEEIIASDVIQYIKMKEIAGTFQNWVQKLQASGTLYIESWDYNVMGNMLTYDYIQVDQLNNMLFGDDKMQSLHNLVGIESLTKQLGLRTLQKGFKEAKFYLVVQK